MVKCPVCGADNKDQARYCKICGTQIMASEQVPQVYCSEPVTQACAPPPAVVVPLGPPPGSAPPQPMTSPTSPTILPLLSPSRPFWGRLIIIAAAILVIAGVIAAYVYPPSQALVLYLVATLLPATPVPSLMAVATVISVVLAFALFLAAFLMFQGYDTFGGIIGFIAAVSSIAIGGGFVAGFVLGIIGSVLGVMRR